MKIKEIKDYTTQELKDMMINLSFYKDTKEFRKEVLEELLGRKEDEDMGSIEELFKKIYTNKF